MKKLLIFLLIIPLMVLITGCPVGIAYPLGTPGAEKLDNALIGQWEQSDADQEVLRFRIEKINNNSLKLTVLSRGSMYMEEVDEFNGWCTTINDTHFVYFQDANNNTAEYYHYAYSIEGKTLTTWDITLLDGGTDAVVSTAAFRDQVQTSMQKPDFLANKVVWTAM